jgi:CheY-like chemotaxis protein
MSAMKTILFVDDNEALARLSCDILQMHGYRAISAFSGEDALEKMDKEKSDLVVTDVRMPGISGIELANKLRERDPKTPIIVVTGYDHQGVSQDLVVLPKADLFPGLLDQIKTHLKAAEPTSADAKKDGTETLKAS